MGIDDVLRKPTETGLIPGVVALAADDRDVFYQGAFGRRAIDKPEPITLYSVFRIASMTKAVTGTAAMQLVEQQRIGLDQPIGDVLPVVKNVKVLEGFDPDGAPRLRDPRVPITLRHLLTHTSGYGYDIFNPDLRRYIEVVGLPSILSHKNESLRVPLLFDPGAGWEYGIGIDLAGKVVEAVSGQPLEAYFRHHIFEPLKMRDTSFLLNDDMARRLVGAHARGSDGKPAPISFEPPQDADFHAGGAGLFSTAPDYLAFTRMLLAGGTVDGAQILKQETVELMARNAIGDLEVPMMRSNNPALALEVETFPGQVKKWGLTFLINTKDVEGFRAAGSLTWGGIHNTFFWIDLKRRITAVAMMQILPIGDPQVIGTMVAFEQALYATKSRA
ncbi:MAG: serine hydrolase domain-containing protein [Methylocella sp.]